MSCKPYFLKTQHVRLALITIMVVALLQFPFLTLRVVDVHGQQTHTFTIIVEGEGYVSVNGSPLYPKTPPGTYTYDAGTVLSVVWVHTRDPGGGGSDLDHFEINGINIGLPPIPYIIVMNADYVLKAVFVPIEPISFIINPLSATTHENESVTFVATTVGKGVPPIWLYWYLNETLVDCSNDFSYSHQWTFEPSDPGTYHVYVTGTDSWEAIPPNEWPKSQIATVNVQGVKIRAHCNLEDADVSVDIIMDGSQTGYVTPHTFLGLAGTHTFTVQSSDPEGHAFKHWSTGETDNTKSISSDGTYTVYYPAEHALNVMSTTGGTTDPLPGIRAYYEGTTVEVTAQPNTRYCLDHWELDGINIGNANPLNVLLNTDRTLKALFARLNFTLTVMESGGGLTSPAPGVYTYSVGSVVSFSALPNVGYYLDSLELDGLQVSPYELESVTMDANHTLQATFEPLKTGDDVAVKWVYSPKTVVCHGYCSAVSIVAINVGGFPESFNVTVYVNGTVLASQQVTLDSGAYVPLTFTWNTTGFATGNYRLQVVAEQVPNETDTSDNSITLGWITVTRVGDLNCDDKCDGRDLIILSRAFASYGPNYHYPGSPATLGWNPNADINSDRKCDGRDIITVARHFGEGT